MQSGLPGQRCGAGRQEAAELHLGVEDVESNTVFLTGVTSMLDSDHV